MKINELSIRDFKGIKSFQCKFTDFNYIIGDNGKGKTTVLDAIYWVLMGYDTEERKQFEIKPLTASGGKKRHTETYVFLSLTFDNGETHTISKSLNGNRETKVKIDDYQKTMGELQDFISANIINYNKFRLFFNPRYFPNLPWKSARDEFLKYFKMPTVNDVVKGTEIPPEFTAELKVATPQEIIKKYRALEKDTDRDRIRVKAQIEELEELLKQSSYDPDMDYNALVKKRMDLREAIQNYNEQAKEYNNFLSKVNELQGKIDDTRREIEYQKRFSNIEKQNIYKQLNHEKKQWEEELVELRDEYQKIQADKEAEHSCPYCGAKLTGEKLKTVKQQISLKEKKNIDSGLEIKSKLEKIRTRILQLEKETEDEGTSDKVVALDQTLTKLQMELVGVKIPDEPQSVGDLSREYEDVSNQLGSYDNNQRYRKSLETLSEKLKEYAVLTERYKKNVLYAEKYLHEQANYIVSRVNKNFRNIHIELFKKLKSGEEKETFVIKLNGVPYSDLNRAGKIIAGLEIQRYFKQHAKNKIPVIIDDFESYPSIDIKDYINQGEQVVLSIVELGKELTVKSLKEEKK